MVVTDSASFLFRCVLVTGGGGGIGKALAKYFLSKGKKVIIAGRTESTLAETCKEIKATGYYKLDTGAATGIPAFVKTITQDHPDLDCLVNNAGVQRPLEVLKMKPDDFLTKTDQEIDINIRDPMHLTMAFLPQFQDKAKCPHGATIMNVSSVLGFIDVVEERFSRRLVA